MDFSLADEKRWEAFWYAVTLTAPELLLVLGMCAVIIVPFFKRRSHKLPAATAVIALVVALLGAWSTLKGSSEPIFHGMLAIDPFSQMFKMLLIVFTIMIIGQWFVVRDPKSSKLDTPDFMCLLLGATFGMSIMASANNLLMIFLAMESASFPSFALAGFRKLTKKGTEGALKYVIFGAASSAVMIYGMSLVYGATGSLNLGEVAAAASTNMSPLLCVGLLGMFAGLAFKLSAVPLHFWCPDVFEGAPIEVTTYLSVASKGAAIVLLVRVAGAFGFEGSFPGIAAGIGILGGITATWGNLCAYHQTNIKRLLAYSSIGHAGYMIMAASLMAAGGDVSTEKIAGGIMFYLFIYMFMNLGAFTIAALIAQRTGSEDIRDYADLKTRSTSLAVFMLICLMSLFGMPGLGGFIAKIYLAISMDGAGLGSIMLVSVLFFNTLLSLFYYMRPVVIMFLRKDDQDRPAIVPEKPGWMMVCGCVIVLGITGVLPGVGEFTREHNTIVRTEVKQAAPVPTVTIDGKTEPLAQQIP